MDCLGLLDALGILRRPPATWERPNKRLKLAAPHE